MRIRGYGRNEYGNGDGHEFADKPLQCPHIVCPNCVKAKRFPQIIRITLESIHSIIRSPKFIVDRGGTLFLI